MPVPLPSLTCPALSDIVLLPATVDANVTVEVNGTVGNVGNEISETKLFAHGQNTSETFCVRDNFVRGCVVVVRGCVVVVVGVDVRGCVAVVVCADVDGIGAMWV